MTASQLAEELEVSVRTIYRDIDALSAAGVPVWAEPGPGGGCELLDGYRMPLSGFSQDEAEALLTLGVPEPLRDLGFGPSLESARQQVRAAGDHAVPPITVHIDVPRWFGTQESVPHLPQLAEAIRLRRRVNLVYKNSPRHDLGTLGLVNKAGTWYAVVVNDDSPFVLRVARIQALELLPDEFDRPEIFDLVSYWTHWSTEFELTRPVVDVLVRASPSALKAMPEVFGERVLPAIDDAVADAEGWRVLQLSFEHDAAAVARLAGFADQVEVLSPPAIRERLVVTAHAIIATYEPT